MRLITCSWRNTAIIQFFLSLEGIFGIIPVKIHDFALGISIQEEMGQN